MQPIVPGFTITDQLSSDNSGSTWAAVRTFDDRRLVVRIISVTDAPVALAQAVQLTGALDRIKSEHVVRQHGAIALADGTLALVLDSVTGGALARLVDDRLHLTPGETVTTVAPLFRALADLHEAGIVHGGLVPGSVLFSAEGRPVIGDLGVAMLLGPGAASVVPSGGFMAPEVVAGGVPTPASDVYSMAALGWFCLCGAPPADELTHPPVTTSTPRTRARLLDALASCLCADPSARPSARVAALAAFDAAPAESVVLTSAPDPAAEITRRIRATAAPAPAAPAPSVIARLRRPLAMGAVGLVAAFAIGGGLSWFLGRTPTVAQSAAVRSTPTGETSTGPTAPVAPRAARTTSPATSAPATSAPQGAADVMTARDSPRVAAEGLLQALVDARALAYSARNPVLLDLVYAPGATKAGADRANLAIALDKGATYLGLAFVVTNAAFLDGTSDTARIRATIVTPAYQTGQPDGRKVPHAEEAVGPSVFTLSLTRDGWRILGLAAP